MFVLPDLPYAQDALEPVMSGRTLRFHHGKHHATYVKTLNELLAPEDKVPESLEAIIRQAAKSANHKLFNNAAQAWNHSFFWVAMSPKRERPDTGLAAATDKAFGGLPELKKAFVTAGAEHFGSGWVWLTANNEGSLKVRSTHDADDTLTHGGITPLLVCDLWEHAYYLDHQSDRKGFLEAWFDALPNWKLASAQFAAAQGEGEAWRHPAPSNVRLQRLSRTG